MKCPKCEYLGFETGDRCKNCGYDFSLLAAPAAADDDLSLIETPLAGTEDAEFWLNQLDHSLAPGQRHEQPGRMRAEEEFFDISLDTLSFAIPDSASPALGIPDLEWDDELPPPGPPIESPVALMDPPVTAPVTTPVTTPVMAAGSPSPAPVVEFARTSALPLFTVPGDEDDAPLIKLPAAPRPPLAVRRTPDTPRLRAVPKPLPRREPDVDPGLVFGSEPAAPGHSAPAAASPHATEAHATSRVWRGGPASNGQPGSAGRRLAAVLIDHAILLAIDLVVVYFTLRMASLDVSSWALLPPAPLVLFLMLIKLSYFCAFTAIGGQTIGKMAARIRVVTSDDRALDVARAARRTLLGLCSALTLGLGFLPGLVGDHRALHDRAAGTRVVGLESA